LTTITKDGSNLVSKWNDKLAGVNNIEQATSTKMPVYSESGGLSFNSDSVDDYLRKIFTVNQPLTIYMLVRQNTWTQKYILGMGTIFLQQVGFDPGGIKIYGGSAYSAENSRLYIGSMSLVRMIFNGATSKLQVNKSLATSGSYGTSALGRIALANSSASTPTTGANISVKELLVRNIEDTPENYDLIYDYLIAKNSIKEVVYSGDSTTAFIAASPIYVRMASLSSRVKTYMDVAIGGEGITQQKARLLNVLNDHTRVCIIMIGLNDVTMTTPVLIATYQDLIDTVRGIIGASNKIMIATLIPCNLSADQQYIDLNEAIRGNGATPISGVDARIDTTATAMNAGDGTLAVAYDSGDGLHQNAAGRQIIADLYDAQLVAWGI
jgi:hypothetical protein